MSEPTPYGAAATARQLRAATAVLLATLCFAIAPSLLADETIADGTKAPAVAKPSAKELALQSMEAMGGREAFEATRYYRFNFFGFRTHHWDRHSGHHRLEGQTREGESYVVLHNLNTRKGAAWLNGEALDGEKLDEWLKNAHSAWINDTYWLLMPYKMLDPGVTLAYDGEETLDGVVFDKLLLTFVEVGLTPGDRYWAYINRETGLMDRWAYFLEGWEREREPTHWLWTDWDRSGNILLSPRRYNPDGEREALLSDLAVFDTLPEDVFTSPDPVVVD